MARTTPACGTVNPELAAAEQREREARTALDAAEEARRIASAVWQEAAEEALTLSKRAHPVRELALHRIKDISPPPTARGVITYTLHDAPEVKACLTQLVAEGAVRCEGGRYYANPQP